VSLKKIKQVPSFLYLSFYHKN